MRYDTLSNTAYALLPSFALRRCLPTDIHGITLITSRNNALSHYLELSLDSV